MALCLCYCLERLCVVSYFEEVEFSRMNSVVCCALRGFWILDGRGRTTAVRPSVNPGTRQGTRYSQTNAERAKNKNIISQC